jgi:hypothetical protein
MRLAVPVLLRDKRPIHTAGLRRISYAIYGCQTAFGGVVEAFELAPAQGAKIGKIGVGRLLLAQLRELVD